MLHKIIEYYRHNKIICNIVAGIGIIGTIIGIIVDWNDFFDKMSNTYTIKAWHIFIIIVVFIILISTLVDKKSKVIKYNSSYRSTNWKNLFSSAEQSITICAFYLDSFLSWTSDDLQKFLKKDNVKLNVIVTEPNTSNLELIARLFPQYKKDVVEEKIIGTEDKIREIIRNLQISDDKFVFYKYKYFLNYSYILVDEKYLYLTIYEMQRNIKKDSPSIIVDLTKDKDIREYILKEDQQIKLNSL